MREVWERGRERMRERREGGEKNKDRGEREREMVREREKNEKLVEKIPYHWATTKLSREKNNRKAMAKETTALKKNSGL